MLSALSKQLKRGDLPREQIEISEVCLTGTDEGLMQKGARLRVWCAVFLVGALFSTTAGGDSPVASDHHKGTIAQEFQYSIEKIEPLLQRYGYGAAVAAVMVEGMGIPAPGQILLIAGSLEAAQGRMNIALLLLLVTAAAVIGNSIGYAIGRWGGRAALNKLRISAQRQQRWADLFNRWGGLVILTARFLDGLRQLNGIVAGVMQMPWWTFTAYNVAGAILWTCAWGLGTYFLGRDVHGIAGFFHMHAWLLYALGMILFVTLLLYLSRSSRHPFAFRGDHHEQK